MNKFFVSGLLFIVLWMVMSFVIIGCMASRENSTDSTHNGDKDYSVSELEEEVVSEWNKGYSTLISGLNFTVYTFEDKEIGVWYLVSDNGVICPRYNSDGSLYTGF